MSEDGLQKYLLKIKPVLLKLNIAGVAFIEAK